MSIIIGADIIPQIKENESAEDFLRGFDPKLQELFQNHRVLLNLETPLADKKTPITKKGPSFCTPTVGAKALKALGADIVCIANNHILDQGEQGLKSTCMALKEAGLEYVGDQQNEKNAAIFVSEGGKTVAIYACAENEFSVANEQHGGAVAFDCLESFDEVRNVKEKADFLIVLYHGGVEEYPYPSPLLQKTCRKFAQCGADLVICQHSHCIGCMEQYHGAVIVYGQGNFAFSSQAHPLWNKGLLICVDVASDASVAEKVSFLPTQSENGYTKTADEPEAILKDFFARSEQILQPDFVKNSFSSLAKEKQSEYFCQITGLQAKIRYRVLRRIFGKGFVRFCAKRAVKQKTKLTWIDYVQCEAHRELLLQCLWNQSE